MSTNVYNQLNNPNEHRTCLVCQRRVYGRSDKKFCSDLCRNHHHNELNREVLHLTRKINARLRHNRYLLANGNESIDSPYYLSYSDLLTQGFDPIFHTHFIWTKNKTCYTCCYDFGFRLTTKNYLEVVNTQNLKEECFTELRH